LAAGIRDSRVDDLVVLCPTCHRCAHMKADDKLSPLSVEEVAKLMAQS
jgi:predicted HNH restriction endonuclease